MLKTKAPRPGTPDSIAGRHGPIAVRYYNTDNGSDLTPFVWLHGGGFAIGGLDQAEAYGPAETITATGRPVITVDYSLVPMLNPFRSPKPGVELSGKRYPVPVDDVVDVLEHVARTYPGYILGGASAGACIAAGTALRLRDSASGYLPEGLVLAYGLFHPVLPAPSTELRQQTRGLNRLPQLGPKLVDRMTWNYAGTLRARQEPYAFPGGHELSGMPKTLMVDADKDRLRASSGLFAQELRDAGTEVTYELVANTFHGFLAMPGKRRYNDGMGIILRWLGQRA